LISSDRIENIRTPAAIDLRELGEHFETRIPCRRIMRMPAARGGSFVHWLALIEVFEDLPDETNYLVGMIHF